MQLSVIFFNQVKEDQIIFTKFYRGKILKLLHFRLLLIFIIKISNMHKGRENNNNKMPCVQYLDSKIINILPFSFSSFFFFFLEYFKYILEKNIYFYPFIFQYVLERYLTVRINPLFQKLVGNWNLLSNYLHLPVNWCTL